MNANTLPEPAHYEILDKRTTALYTADQMRAFYEQGKADALAAQSAGEAVVRDAERYRWLRLQRVRQNQDGDDIGWQVVKWGLDHKGDGAGWIHDREALDAAIDEASRLDRAVKSCAPQHSDDELPGMWERSDFSGGRADSEDAAK